MSLELVYYGNQTLKDIAEEVMDVDGKIIKLIDTMYKIMYKERGIGLAAPQVDIGKRIILLDLEASNGPSMALINPVIKEFSDRDEPYEEGCLSLPGITADIIRPSEIIVSGIDPQGNEVEFEADDLLARVIQHEVDHLGGKVFIDHLEDYEKNELRPQLKKIKKMNRKK